MVLGGADHYSSVDKSSGQPMYADLDHISGQRKTGKAMQTSNEQVEYADVTDSFGAQPVYADMDLDRGGGRVTVRRPNDEAVTYSDVDQVLTRKK